MTRLCHRTAAFRPDDRGTALVEGALVLPIVAFVLFGIIELGFLFASATVSSGSTRGGARLASSTYGFTDSAADRDTAIDQIRLTVEEELNQLSPMASPVEMWIYPGPADGQPPGASNFDVCSADCVRLGWGGSSSASTRARGPVPTPVDQTSTTLACT